jgi:2-dehydro-3-deoxy-D-arabinonate dehydratase
MRLAKYRMPTGEIAVGQLDDERLLPLDLSRGQYRCLSDILDADDPLEVADFLISRHKSVSLEAATLLAPIDHQEVWAAGVTYRRSRTARMEESESAASCYDRVYASPRPELFFKATPHRVCGPGEPLRIRADSNWNVPEPEITLVLDLGSEVGRIHGRQRHEFAGYRGRKSAVSAAGQSVRRLLRTGAVRDVGQRHAAAASDRDPAGHPP